MAEDQDTNKYVDPEELEAQKKLATLHDQAHEGALFADWKNSYCSQKFLKFIEEQITDSRNRWLLGTEDDAKAIRYEARAFQKVKMWINAQIGAGTVASLGVKQFHKEGIELEGLIKPPPQQ